MLELSFEKEVVKTLTTDMVRRRINYGLIFVIN